MNGTIRSKKAGVWELVFDVGRDPLTNRRRQRSRTFKGTKRAAERELRRLVTDVEKGRMTGGEMVMAELFEKWLDLAEDELSPTTVREYRRLVAKRINPAIGDIPITKLQTARLDEFYQALTRDENLSSASVRQMHSVIRRGLKQAVKWGWLQHNVAVDATPPRLRQKEAQPPSVRQVQSLIASADRYDASFGVFVRLAAATGMRRGELLGLRWSDVNFDKATIQVRRAVIAIPEGTAVKSTKTRANRRLVLDNATMKTLDRHYSAMVARAHECEDQLDPDGYVFSHEPDSTRPWHPDNATGAFRRLRGNNGISRLHDLRHFHATQLLMAGVPLKTVSARLGHAMGSTTINFYAHILEDSDQEAADAIGDLLGPDATDGETVTG